LELLDSRLSSIGAWYEDSSWADGIQQQLAAIEQAFATGMQQQQQQQQQQFDALEVGKQLDGESSLQAAAAAAAACSSELLWSHSHQEVQLPSSTQQQQQLDADAAALPAAKAFVTTPSGHVSMISSRRGTQVLSALDVAIISSSRRATVVESMSGAGRRSRPRTCSSIGTMRATADAAAATADDGAVDGSSCGNAAAGGAAAGPAAGAGAAPWRYKARRSTLGAVARAACASEQQQELACEQQQQKGTLLVLSEAAQRLSAEQEEEEQQQQQLWQHGAVADGPSEGSNEPLLLLNNSIATGGDGYGAADAFEACISQLPAEQEAGWSPAAALVDAMQQAALAVLTRRQQPLAPIAEHEQLQQRHLQGEAVAASALLQQQQASPAPEAVAPEVDGQGQGASQQLEFNDVDGDEDAFWDAEEAEAGASAVLFSGSDQLDVTLAGPAAASQQQQQQCGSLQQQCGSLQLLKQQLAVQRARTQQLQQQLELEHSQSGGGSSLEKLHSGSGCSAGAVAADMQQQQQGQSPPRCNILGRPEWLDMEFTFKAPEAATEASSYSCVTEWGSVIAEAQHATADAVMQGDAAGSKGAGDAEQQLLECRVALAAQHAACEELRQQNQQLVAALQNAGCSV
jgi:hypothetical protein